jgi:hypothetical protein
MQHVLRPYATAGIALVGASIIAVTPVAAPPIKAQVRPVQLVDAWSDLITNTTTNLDNIISNANSSDITQVFSDLLTNPYGVIAALANVDPTVTTDLTSLPATISVDLPPGLELMIAGLGSSGATLTALESVAQQLQSDPSFTNLYEGVATVLNAYLNGQDNISLLDGAITIPLYNGILAPETSADININLTSLIDALGLGNTPLTDLDLSSLLSQIGLGDLSLGSLFSDLGLSGQGLGTLLANATNPVTTLSGLLNLLGLDNLGSGDSITLTLTNILNGLGLDTNVDLNNLSLSTVLTAFDLNPNADVGLVGFLNAVGLTGLTSETLGSLLGSTDLDDIVNNIVSSLLGNSTLSTLLTPVETLLTTVLDGAIAGDLNVTVSTLLGGQTLAASLDTILAALGTDVTDATPLSSLTIGGVLGDLGFSSSTGDLTLGGLLSDLGNPFGLLNITDLLNTLNLGDLLGDLGLSSLPLNLSDLGDLSNLTLGDLLGDLGLGDLANVSVEPLGGFDTLLADVVPQQILAALGM